MSAVNAGLTSKIIRFLVTDPITPQTLYVLTNDGIFKSANGGASWSSVIKWLPNDDIISLAVDPVNPQVLYFGTYGAVLKSVDGGANWSFSSSGQAGRVLALVIDPSNHQVLYAVASDGIRKSDDGGTSWSNVSIGFTGTFISALAIDPSSSLTLYVAATQGVLKSIDGGSSWSTLNAGFNGSHVLTLAIDPISPQTIYAGCWSEGVMKSVDGGANWSPVNTGMMVTDVFSLAFDPTDPKILYAGTGGGVYKTLPEATVTYPLSVTRSGSGTGMVTSSPTDTTFGATFSTSFVSGTSVILTATPDSGSMFAGWSGDCTGTGTCTVTMNAAKNVTALFNQKVSGSCGSSSGGTFTVAPAVNLCSAGTASNVFGSGPWHWICLGSNGGTSTVCSANISNETSAIASPTTGGDTASAAGSSTSGAGTQSAASEAAASAAATAAASAAANDAAANDAAARAAATAAASAVATSVPLRTGIVNPAQGKTVPDVSDALRALNIAVGNITPTATDYAQLDVAPLDGSGRPKGDHVIDTYDVIGILRMMVGLL